MALFIRTTFFFKTLQGGWSESWHNLTAGSLSAAETDARNAGMKRIAICGLGSVLAGARVSDQDAVPKRSKLVDLAGMGIGLGEIPAEGLTGYTDAVLRSADQLQSALLIRGLSAAGVQKNLWLGGIPDFIVRTNPAGPDLGGASPAWVARYTTWRAEFQSGRWGFRARRRVGADVQPQDIVDYVLQAGAVSRLGLVVNNGGPVYSTSQRVQIRNVKLVNPAFRSPTGTWAIHSRLDGATQTTYFLLNSEGIAPTNVTFRGNVRLVDFEAVAISDLSIVRQSNHQRGRPFGLFRGRVRRPIRV